ncbi:copper amine oxidase N-terminal domain-containing protein [Paenibacillus sp. FSL R7-0312]|uniref:copper amine oxidase N-terminal domain-containing protein n=1 Tax=Paenibacillus sp. FSL R7-0312 TaxID=2921682 RepID=UPI0030F4DF65
MRKKLIKAMLIPLVFSTLTTYSVSAASDSLKLKLQIGSKTVVINETQSAQLLQSPFIKDNSTYIPLRFISEQLNAGVQWDQKNKVVTITKDDKIITLKVNDKQVKINDSIQSLESPALIVGGATFVPLRFVSENLNVSLTWEQKSQSITIQTQSGAGTTSDAAATSNTVTTSNAGTNTKPVTPNAKTDEEQIREVIQTHIDYLNNKDAAGVLRITYKPTETKEQLQSNFDTYDMEYSIDNVSDISVKGSEATALVTRIAKRYAFDFNKVEPEKYLEVHMKIVFDTSFVKVNGEWKVYRLSNKGTTNLLKK